jgi:hypothetical protein
MPVARRTPYRRTNGQQCGIRRYGASREDDTEMADSRQWQAEPFRFGLK